MSVDVVEIESALLPIAKEYFDYQENSRITNHISDGRYFLRTTDATYDVIFNDVYLSLFSIPIQFTTQEYFELVFQKLGDDGIIIINLIGKLDPQTSPYVFSEIKTLQSVFPHVEVLALASLDPNELQNIILIGTKNDVSLIDNNLPTELTHLVEGKLLDLTDLDLLTRITYRRLRSGRLPDGKTVYRGYEIAIRPCLLNQATL